MRRAGSFALLLLLPLLLPGPARAEPLPGLLDHDEVEELRRDASRQKRDTQAALRGQARALGYNKDEIRSALMPAMDRSGTFRVTLEDGTVVEFPWFRIGFAENRLANTDKVVDRQRNQTNKGGIRLHKGVFHDEVYSLALKMEAKLAIARDALLGDYVRGAKGGIGAGRVVTVGTRYQAKVGDYVDPASAVFDRGQLMEKFADAYRDAGGEVGPGLDIQAGDVNTKAPEMKVLSERYGSPSRPSAGVSGKAVRLYKNGRINPIGGIEYRAISTGEGVWMSARLAAIRVGLRVRGATVFAQGWGEVGRAFGLAAAQDGARVIGVQENFMVGGRKEVLGVLMNPLGADARPGQVREFMADVDALRAGADVATYKGGRYAAHFHEGLDASAVRADIVGTNALGGVLNDRTVPAYKASGTHQGRRKIIVEGANLAETAGGAHLLDLRSYAKKILTVPGDVANLGGVHVSDLEAVQNFLRRPVSNPVARRSLTGTIRSAWLRAMKVADREGLGERRAVERIAIDGLMRRSLHRSNAPKALLEKRVAPRPPPVRSAPASRR